MLADFAAGEIRRNSVMDEAVTGKAVTVVTP